jgi:hypothetical protein
VQFGLSSSAVTGSPCSPPPVLETGRGEGACAGTSPGGPPRFGGRFELGFPVASPELPP